MTYIEIFSFVVAASLLVMSPGPNGVLIAKTVPTSGRVTGFANVAGFVSAFYVHGALSILGISILLVQSPIAFTFVKLLGATYLFWIGLRAILDAFKGNQSNTEIAAAKKKKNLSRAFFEGFLTNVLNPKVSMFYLAAFPQFISTGHTSVMSSFFLVFLHSMINAIWFGGMVLLFDSLASVTRNVTFQRWLKGTTGIVFMGFGVKLASLQAKL